MRCNESRSLATSGVRQRISLRPGARRLGQLDAPDAVEGGGAEHRPQRPAGLGPGVIRRDALGQPRPEHHAFEQRVRGQPVGPVHAGARHLAHGPQAGQRRRPPQVGDDAPGKVVRRRGDREPIGLGVETDRRERRRNGREALREPLQAGGVQPQMIRALFGHAGRHGPAHHIARGQLVDEPLSRVIA